MADSLNFSLVSPERELATGEAASVLVPGTEGVFEVQANHAPVMSTLSPGMLEIRQAGEVVRYYVRGGFADVTSAGLTILAEIAIPEAELIGDVLAAEKDFNDKATQDTSLDAEAMLNAHRAVDVLSRI